MTAIDQHARDEAISATGTSIALSAGAGSGKTSVLTARLVRLLSEGVAPDRIAAITFTEKAAGELQVRVRDALEHTLAVRNDPVLERALGRLPELTLATIHSFCQRLLTTEALDAGWAPGTELMPGILRSAEVQGAYDGWSADFLARHPSAGVVLRYRVKEITLLNSALRVLEYRDLEPIVDPASFDPEAAFPALQQARARIEAAANACTNPDDKLLTANATLRELLHDVVSGPPAQAVLRVLASDETGRTSGGRKADWSGDGKQGFVDAVLHYRAWVARQEAALHGLVVRDLFEHFLPAVADAKGRAAAADFDDLLFRTAALLEGPIVRRRVAGRYDAILIDEVQDTDPIQAEVAALLTRDPNAQGPWTAHPPLPGRLFAVGDPRQSIYRFRRADVETWAQLQTLVARDGEALGLTQNFRSVPGIVSWVNHTFADLAGYRPQQPYRNEAELEPVVRVPCTRDNELDSLARYLGHLQATGRVVDPATGTLRPVRWSDVMMLLPAWTQAERVQAELTRAGIPCLVEGGGAFFDRDEVRLCVAALTCLDEPGEERATVLVLRGLFGLDWETLARHRAADGAWRYTVPDPPPGPVAEAFGQLRDLARWRGRRPWVALLDGLLENTRATSVWAGLADGEARLANLDKLRALLRQVEAVARSPSDALRRLGQLQEDKEKDLSRVDVDSDAVRITSYFKAKGLEAPVVVLPFGKRNGQGVQVAVDRGTRRVALKVGSLVPADWSAYEEAREGGVRG